MYVLVRQMNGIGLRSNFVLFLQTEGRQLPLEKIILGSSQFQSSPQADWGQQAVKEQVITPVPLRKWLVFFVNRDKSKAIDFINMMKKVTPAMGIQVRVISATEKLTTKENITCKEEVCLGKRQLQFHFTQSYQQKSFQVNLHQASSFKPFLSRSSFF